MGIFSHRLLAGMAIGALAAVPAVSSADSITGAELQFDVNSATIKAVYQNGNPGFGGVTHTGSLQFGTDADSEVGLQLNGSPQSSVFSGRLVGFSGRIDFVGGISQEQTGFIRLIIENADESHTTDEYSFQVAAGAQLYGPVGRSSYRPLGFQLYADTFGGTFVDGNNDGTFGGVDIRAFKDQPSLNGVFFQLKYNPNSATGFSSEVDVEIITTAPLPDPSTGTPVVPTPAAALSGFGLLGLLGAAQWYRSSRRKAADE